MTDRPGSSFSDGEVVDLYGYRPPYPATVFEKLLELAPRHDAVLDIGCGPGKVSRPLTRSFANVVAVDPSQRMIALGRSLPDGQVPNLHWINSLAEEAPLGDWRFDLTVAAASIHWMDWELLFPKLLAHATRGHVFATISGDDAFEPPWDADWKRFLGMWVPEVTGVPFDESLREAIWGGYRRHMDVGGSQYFSAPVEQSVEDFIKCQHSRDTWAYSRLGSRTEAFDAELAELLHDHAVDGQLTYTVRTLVTWGTIRSQ
jgi:SAM-dependent methyltransferase